MDIHEYQAKAILADFGMPVGRGGLAYSPEQAVYRAKELGDEKWVVKAQIHSGARGKAGGIKFCRASMRSCRQPPNCLENDWSPIKPVQRVSWHTGSTSSPRLK